MQHSIKTLFIVALTVFVSGCSLNNTTTSAVATPQVTNAIVGEVAEPTNTATETNNALALGDYKTTLTGPKLGYIYLCRQMGGGQEVGGAFQDGPWIHGSSWNPSEKITVDGDVSWKNAYVTIATNVSNRSITTNGLPTGHTTGEFPITADDDAYQYDRNPNTIVEQTLQLTVPAQPTVSSTPNCVGGEVGIALTGVPIFNGLDATSRDAVAHEIQDSFGGHPQIKGLYHYHNISNAVAELSKADGGMTLVGYAFDGFGIYTDNEFGGTLTTADLDECHGHSHEVIWDGEEQIIYHYHATQDYPYTVSCFRGDSTVHGPLGE